MESLSKTERVMIACVTDEVIMVTSPLETFGIDRVHLINYIKKVDENKTDAAYYRAKYYEAFRDAVDRKVPKGCEKVWHNDKLTFHFDDMMQTVYGLIRMEQERGNKVYVNLSSGSKEYCAAAAIASMMFDDVELFTVGGDREALTQELYEHRLDSMKHDGELVGTYYKFKGPYEVKRFKIDTPSQRLVNGLKVFSLVPIELRTNTNVVRNLIRFGLWGPKIDENAISVINYTVFFKGTSYELEEKESDDVIAEMQKLRRKEAVQYQRNFIDKWLDLEWIEKSGNKYEVTEMGQMNIDVFCQDDIFPIIKGDILIR